MSARTCRRRHPHAGRAPRTSASAPRRCPEEHARFDISLGTFSAAAVGVEVPVSGTSPCTPQSDHESMESRVRTCQRDPASRRPGPGCNTAGPLATPTRRPRPPALVELAADATASTIADEERAPALPAMLRRRGVPDPSRWLGPGISATDSRHCPQAGAAVLARSVAAGPLSAHPRRGPAHSFSHSFIRRMGSLLVQKHHLR